MNLQNVCRIQEIIPTSVADLVISDLSVFAKCVNKCVRRLQC